MSGDSLLEALAGYDSPTLSNAIEAFELRGMDAGFCGRSCPRLVGGPRPVVGRAVTATMGSRHPVADSTQRAALYEAVAAVGEPVVVVIADLDEHPGHGAFLGELQATLLSRLGAVAIATNGAVRDLGQLRTMGFTAFAGGPSVSHACAHLLEVNVEVELDGVRISPGDVLHGDEHGLLLVPEEVLASVPAVADAIIAAERSVLSWAASGELSPGEILDRLAAVKAAARSSASRAPSASQSSASRAPGAP
ncbi:MAG: RraA family protein [Actinomycetota bacterium]|nr:RraA family protein [Actinomycetota bacterium]